MSVGVSHFEKTTFSFSDTVGVGLFECSNLRPNSQNSLSFSFVSVE